MNGLSSGALRAIATALRDRRPIPSACFYGEVGSHAFVSRRPAGIPANELDSSGLAPVVASRLDRPEIELVAIGAGQALYEAAFIGAIRALGVSVRVLLLDASEQMLSYAEQALGALRPALELRRRAFTLGEDLEAGDRPRVFFFAGATFGNFSPEWSAQALARCLAPGDMLVFSVGTTPTLGAPELLEHYAERIQDPVNRAFYLSPLTALGLDTTGGALQILYEPRADEGYEVYEYAFQATHRHSGSAEGVDYVVEPGSVVRLISIRRFLPSGLAPMLGTVGLSVVHTASRATFEWYVCQATARPSGELRRPDRRR